MEVRTLQMANDQMSLVASDRNELAYPQKIMFCKICYLKLVTSSDTVTKNIDVMYDKLVTGLESHKLCL